MATKRSKRPRIEDASAVPAEEPTEETPSPADEPEEAPTPDPAPEEPAPVEEAPPPPLSIFAGAPAPAPKKAPDVVTAPASSAVVVGPQAVDPHRHHGAKPFPMPCHIFCGVAQLHPTLAAGFQAWSKGQGHDTETRERWAELLTAYKTSPVRS